LQSKQQLIQPPDQYGAELHACMNENPGWNMQIAPSEAGGSPQVLPEQSGMYT